MGQSIQQSSDHLRIAKDLWPFGKDQFGGDDARSPFIECTYKMRQTTSRLGKWQIEKVSNAPQTKEKNMANKRCIQETPYPVKPTMTLLRMQRGLPLRSNSIGKI